MSTRPIHTCTADSDPYDCAACLDDLAHAQAAEIAAEQANERALYGEF